MTRVFISYGRENSAQASALAADLAALGLEVWLDKELSGGQAWWDQILARIRQCEAFVFALSPESLESIACDREWRYADKLGKHILPVVVAGNVSDDLMPPRLAGIQYVDYRQQDKPAVIRLMKALSALPVPGPLPEPLPSPPEVPISYLGGLREQVQASRVLSFEEQSALLVTLKQGMREANKRDEVRRLLQLFRRRADLLARVADEVDELLAGRGLPDVTPAPLQTEPVGTSAARTARAPSLTHAETTARLTGAGVSEASPPAATFDLGAGQAEGAASRSRSTMAQKPLERPARPEGAGREEPSVARAAVTTPKEEHGPAAAPREAAAPAAEIAPEVKAQKRTRLWIAAGVAVVSAVVFLAIPASIDRIYLSANEDVMVNQTIDLRPEVWYSSDWRWGQDYVSRYDFAWASSNEAVARVVAGTVTGVAPGTARITARYRGHEDGVEITVLPAMKFAARDVKFYAAADVRPAAKDRQYKTEFDSKTTRKVWTEVTLEIDQTERDRALTVPFSYVLYRSNDKVAENYSFKINIEQSWTTFVYSERLDFEMTPDRYRIEFKHGGKVIGTGSFVLK